MTVALPTMWTYEYYNGERWMRLLTTLDPSIRGPHDPTPIRNVQMWGAGPVPVERPAPAQPATDPAVEAARRKALRALFNTLHYYRNDSDSSVGMVSVAVLRDLLGQPRKFAGRVPGYDEEPDLKVAATMRETRVNTAGPERVSPPLGVQAIAETLFAGTDDFWERGKKWQTANRVQRASALERAIAVHRLVYGRNA